MVCQSWCVKDLPRHHSSSPCKPSFSEPQRTLLAVELQILILFNMLASMFYSFSMFSEGFLQCPHFPKRFPRFPWFFQAVFPSLPFSFSSSLSVFFAIFLRFSLFALFSTLCLHFPWFFLRGIEPHHHQIALWYTPPKKTPFVHANRFLASLGNVHPPHPLYSLHSQKQLCLA